MQSFMKRECANLRLFKDAHVTTTSKAKCTVGRNIQLIQAKGGKGQFLVFVS